MAEYFRRGTSEVYWLTAAELTTLEAADPTTPTQAQHGTWDNVTSQISDLSGWEFTNSPISTPKLSTTFTTTIIGEDTAGNPEITFYDQDSTPTPNPRALMAKGNTGAVCLADLGSGTGNPTNVWPVSVIGLSDNWSIGNEAATYTVQFAVSKVPYLGGSFDTFV